jgi:hypothetical protein
LDKNRKVTDGYQSLYSYPYFAGTANASNWTWRSNPFLFDFSNVGGNVISGADYLLAYWMGRYYNVIAETD